MPRPPHAASWRRMGFKGGGAFVVMFHWVTDGHRVPTVNSEGRPRVSVTWHSGSPEEGFAAQVRRWDFSAG